jgi:hypothetical protein
LQPCTNCDGQDPPVENNATCFQPDKAACLS